MIVVHPQKDKGDTWHKGSIRRAAAVINIRLRLWGMVRCLSRRRTVKAWKERESAEHTEKRFVSPWECQDRTGSRSGSWNHLWVWICHLSVSPVPSTLGTQSFDVSQWDAGPNLGNFLPACKTTLLIILFYPNIILGLSKQLSNCKANKLIFFIRHQGFLFLTFFLAWNLTGLNGRIINLKHAWKGSSTSPPNLNVETGKQNISTY